MNNYFTFDGLNIFFTLILLVVTSAVVVYQGKQKLKYTIIFILFFLSMLGAILSNHLGLTWVFVEATTLTSAYLILQHKNKNSLEATWKYVFLCSIGISLAFVGIILLLIAAEGVNSLFFNDLYANASTINAFWLKLSFIFTLIGFGTKVGLAPVHSWLPDAHAEAPSPVSAMLSATLLNSAFLVIIRLNKLMQLAGVGDSAQKLMLFMGLASLFVTAVYVFRIANYKRMMAYSSIENMGIATIGIALGNIGTIAAAIHLMAHSLIKSGFFLTSGNVLKLYGTKEIADVHGIIKRDKMTGWLWVLFAAFIVAIPPSPLFISEFLILQQMFVSKQIFLMILFAGILTIIMYGILRAVIKTAFGDDVELNTPCVKLGVNKYLPQILLLLIVVIIGFYCPTWLGRVIMEAALWM